MNFCPLKLFTFIRPLTILVIMQWLKIISGLFKEAILFLKFLFAKNRGLNFLFPAAVLYGNSAEAQVIPQKCFEIESILADGCDGGNEGKNEMVYFHTGPDSVNVSDLRVDGAGSTGVIQAGKWPNTSNVWLGTCTNANAAQKIDSLNSLISGCGYLVEPANGILPPGSRVILITSTDFTVIPTYFQNLNDSIYVIFQCAGNTAGHFVNYGTPSSSRTLVLHHIPSGCADTVIYDRSLLTDINGNPAAQDGAAVQYNWNGTSFYYNNGCQAPFIPMSTGIVSLNVIGSGMACPGDTIQLQAIISGSYSEIYWWGGTGVFSDTDSVYTEYITTAADTAAEIIINIRVVGICNDTVYATDTFTVINSPEVQITVSGNDTICEGNTVTLTATVISGTSYLWNTGDTTASIMADSTSDYFVTAANACGSDTAWQEITVNPKPIALITPPGADTICQGDSVVLAASGGDNFQWSGGEVTDSIVVFLAGAYFVTAFNDCGSDTSSAVDITVISPPVASLFPGDSASFCQGDSVTLTASGGNSYSWSTGSNSPSIAVQAAGTYDVTVSNTCGSGSGSIVVSVRPLPAAAISSDTTGICEGDSVLLTASGGELYEWSTGDSSQAIYATQQGNYTVTISNSCGSSAASAGITVELPPAPVITPSGNLSICMGDSVMLTVSGGDAYSWPDGETGDSIFADTAGNYVAIAYNGCGSAVSDTVIVSVMPAPEAKLTTSGKKVLCQGDSIILFASGGTSYSWSTGSTASAITINSPALYSVIVINSCGADTATLDIISSGIQAGFLPDNASGSAPLTVTFTNNSANAISYQWSFGDGNTSVLPEPSNTYELPGEYDVILIATDSSGCSDTATFEAINVSSVIFIPDMFSPNGDGQNDVFRVRGKVTSLSGAIYNRWGQLIYQWNKPEGGWDGTTFSGKFAQAGVYVYVIEITLYGDEKITRAGNVTMVR